MTNRLYADWQVDLLQTHANNAIGINATSTIMSNLFENLNKLAHIGGDDIADKILDYGGKDNQKRMEYSVLGWKSSTGITYISL